MPHSRRQKILAVDKLRIGWSVLRAQLLEARRLQCYRCHALGHVSARCPSSVDRNGECYRCGKSTGCSPRTARSAPAPVGLQRTSPGARLAPSPRIKDNRGAAPPKRNSEVSPVRLRRHHWTTDNDQQPLLYTSGQPQSLRQSSGPADPEHGGAVDPSGGRRRALPGPFGSRLGERY